VPPHTIAATSCQTVEAVRRVLDHHGRRIEVEGFELREHVVHQAEVLDHRALGTAGRPRREDHVGQVAAADAAAEVAGRFAPRRVGELTDRHEPRPRRAGSLQLLANRAGVAQYDARRGIRQQASNSFVRIVGIDRDVGGSRLQVARIAATVQSELNAIATRSSRPRSGPSRPREAVRALVQLAAVSRVPSTSAIASGDD
jgi:hypothetical protein